MPLELYAIIALEPTVHHMHNSKLQDTFTQIIKSLPNDIKLSDSTSKEIIDNFINNVNEPLDIIINKMISKINSDDENPDLETEQKLTQEIMRLMIPYMRSLAKPTDKN